MIDLKKNMSYNFNDELCNIKNSASDTVRGSVYSTEGIDILSRNIVIWQDVLGKKMDDGWDIHVPENICNLLVHM